MHPLGVSICFNVSLTSFWFCWVSILTLQIAVCQSKVNNRIVEPTKVIKDGKNVGIVCVIKLLRIFAS